MSKKRRNKDRHIGPLLWIIYICAVVAVLTLFLQSAVPGFRMTFFKALGFQSVVTVMFAVWVALAVADRRYRPRKSSLVIAVIVYAAVLSASLAFSMDPQLSFWSSERRMTGVAFILHCVAWFLVLSSVLRTRKEWDPFLAVMAGAATVMALIGIAQSFATAFSQPIISALGNTSYFAAYLLITLFITGYLFVGSRGKQRHMWGIAFVAQAVATILTSSRGALLTLLVCFLLGAVGLVLVSRLSRGRKLLAVGGAVLLTLLSVGVFLLIRTPAGQSWVGEAGFPHFITRVSLKNFGEDRLVLWDIALKGIAERPVFGWGSEQYETVFGAHYDPYGPGREFFFERWFDKAHNQYLDALIAFGAVGMVAYAIIWLVVAVGFVRAFRNADNVRERRGLIMLALGAVAYLVYSFFMFDTTSQLIMLFALLAFLTVALPEIAGRVYDEPSPPDTGAARTRSKYVLLAAAPLLLAVIWFADLRPFVMAGELSEVNGLIKSNRTAAAVELPKALGGFNPYIHDFRFKSVSAVIPLTESVHIVSPQMEELLTILSREAVMTVESRPTNIRAQLAAAVVHRLLGEYDASYLDDAERFVADAEQVAPGNHAVYQERGEILMLRDDPVGALVQYEKALGMVFEIQQEHKGVLAYRMACAHAMNRAYGSMFDELEKANSLGYRSQHDIRLAEAIASAIGPGDEIGDISAYIDGNLKSYPDHPRLLIAIAQIHGATGDIQEFDEMMSRLRQRGDTPAVEMLMEKYRGEPDGS